MRTSLLSCFIVLILCLSLQLLRSSNRNDRTYVPYSQTSTIHQKPSKFDAKDYIASFKHDPNVAACSGAESNSIYTLYPDEDSRSNKYNGYDFSSIENGRKLQPQIQCMKQLMEMQGVSNHLDVEYPDAKPDIQIPFYVLPEYLPSGADKPGTTFWSECWAEYDVIVETAPKPNNEWAKRTYGYHVARQLENHPWRVYNPDDALIYIIPWFDTLPKLKKYYKSAMCEPVFSMGFIDEAIVKAGQDYPDHLNAANTLVFMGDYFVLWPWWDKTWPTISKFKDSVDYRMWGPDFQPVVGMFYTSPVRQAIRSTAIFHPSPINSTCYYRLDSDECVARESNILRDSKMTLKEWKESRPIKFTNFGQTWNMSPMASRRAFGAAIQLAQTNGMHTGLSEPFIYMTINRSSQEEDFISVCSDNPYDSVLEALEGWNRIEEIENATSLPSVAWNLGHHGMKLLENDMKHKFKVVDFVPYEVQDQLRDRSQFIYSLRGRIGNSQRSYEGLYYGLLTHHDASEDHFAYYAVLPQSMPWRLFGIWNRECISTLSKQLQQESGRHEVAYLDTKIRYVKDEHDNHLYRKQYEDQWSDDDLQRWASDFIKCHEPMTRLMENKEYEDLLDFMRRAIYKYRDDILWEVPNSKAAENVIFEAARLMNRHDPVVLGRFNSESPKHQTWESLGLTESSFEVSKVPKVCLLSDGDSTYNRAWGQWNKELFKSSWSMVDEQMEYEPAHSREFLEIEL